MALAAVLDLPEDELLESVGLSRPAGPPGGSFADLAPVDLDDDEVVVHGLGVPSVGAHRAPSDEDIPPEVAGEVDEAGWRIAEFDQAAGQSDAGASSGVPDEAPAIVEQTPEEHSDRDSAGVSSLRVGRVETHRTAIPPQPLLVQPVQQSYMEDRREMTTYRVRTLLTVAILVVLLLLVEWGLHGASQSLKDALSGLHP